MSDQESLEWETDPDDQMSISSDEESIDNSTILQGYCNELEMCPEFRADATYLSHNNLIRVRIALLPKDANISTEYLSAIGCDLDRVLVLELYIDEYRLGVSTISVGTIDEKEFQQFDKEIPIVHCALSSPLIHRIKLRLQDDWKDIVGERCRQFTQVTQIISVSKVDYFWALTALAASRFEVSDAILALSRIDTTLLQKSCTEQNTSSHELVQQVQDAVPGINRNSALLILLLCQWDLDLAVHLMSHSLIKSIVERASKALNISDITTISILTPTNPVARLADVFLRRILTLNETCYLCNGPLPIAILRLGICDSPLCNHQFEECGIGFSLEEEVCRRPELCDLLISMCASSSKGDRLSIFFPKALQDPKTGNTLSTDQNDVAKIGEMLDKCPGVQQMADLAKQGTLIKHLRQCHPMLPSLLRWIIASNRSHIRLLDKSDHVNGITACYQFVLLTSSPKKESLFRLQVAKASRERPVEYAFHGSPQGNWHSIVRQGLLNMSGTKHMLNGAAYGSGIYMAPNLQTSLGYSRGYCRSSQLAWNNSIFGHDWNAVALCEVANTTCLKKPNPYWVVSDEDMVVTRYLFIFTSHEAIQQRDIDSRSQFNSDLTARFRNLSKGSLAV